MTQSDIGVIENSEAFCISRHHTVLDAIVDRFHKVSRPSRAAVQIALFGQSGALVCPGARDAVLIPGAMLLNIGSKCLTTCFSPQIIRQ